jgi:hypothetical protein
MSSHDYVKKLAINVSGETGAAVPGQKTLETAAFLRDMSADVTLKAAYQTVIDQDKRLLDAAVIAMAKNPILQAHGISGMEGVQALAVIMRERAAMKFFDDIIDPGLAKAPGHVTALKGAASGVNLPGSA